MDKKHQVVFIMTDTTRHDMVGCYGNPDMKTPSIDRLASEGVRYSKAYSCQPVCGPARSAIFTGLYPHSNGSFTNCVPLWAGVKTVGQRLSEKGVHSVYIGKWHLDGGDYFGNGFCPEGFDDRYWFDMKRYLDELSDDDKVKSRKESSSLEDGGVDETFTFGHRIAQRAISFLENEGKDEDFFLTVSFDEPHQPYLCPEPFASMYEGYELPITPAYYDDLKDKPELERLWAAKNLGEDKSKLHIRPQLFLGCNSFADYEIGRVLDAVRTHAPDAMVIFTSDHGEALGAHSLSLKGPSVYEEICHIPLIIKGGAYCQAPQGEVYDHVVSHIDITPTILDYFDIPKHPEMPGVTMRPVIENPQGNVLHDVVFSEFHRYEIDHDGFGGIQFMRAAISDRYKLAIFLLDETDELFDCQEDPHELKNLIYDESYAQVRDALHEKLLAMMNDTRDPFRGYQWRTRKWNQDRCRPDWECDYCTRQRPTADDEPRQLDYDTGLPIKEFVRFKKKYDKPAGSI